MVVPGEDLLIAMPRCRCSGRPSPICDPEERRVIDPFGIMMHIHAGNFHSEGRLHEKCVQMLAGELIVRPSTHKHQYQRQARIFNSGGTTDSTSA